jgi:hypothetical protein
MTDEKLKNLLAQTDRIAGAPAEVNINIDNIRRRANRRRILYCARPIAAAASLIIAFALWQGTSKQTKTTPPTQPPLIASIDNQLQQLQDSTNQAIKIIQEIREKEQNQRASAELDTQLASIPDPLEKIQQEVDRTAFILVYSADRMYKELNLTDSAVETYKRVIELFPENQWAKVAQERLETIKTEKSDTHSQGDTKWQLQNALS